jgi:hypothetical protein
MHDDPMKDLIKVARAIEDPGERGAFVTNQCFAFIVASLEDEQFPALAIDLTHQLGVTLQFVAGEANAQTKVAIVKCTSCGWQGREDRLVAGCCPKCGE